MFYGPEDKIRIDARKMITLKDRWP
jgi:hypothetical protein